jgi:hypothetical protein
MDFFSIPMLIVYSCMYGITMKFADLLNEHGLNLFTFSNYIFGFLWGLFGALLILGDPNLANILLAMNIAFLIRLRIDFINHSIAVSLIFITFLKSATFDFNLFIIFYVIFLLFGGLKDIVDDYFKNRKGFLFVLTESMLYYPIPTLIYALFTDNWIVFICFLMYTIAYNFTKFLGKKMGYK